MALCETCADALDDTSALELDDHCCEDGKELYDPKRHVGAGRPINRKE